MTSVKLPAKLEHQMLLSIVGEGYGMRGKSRWIEDAITEFLNMENRVELVEYASEMINLSKVISVRLKDKTIMLIENAVTEVRTQYPNLEGVKSNIIRASIIQKLLHASVSVADI